MNVVQLATGTKLIDTILVLDKDKCGALKEAGVEAVMRYIDAVSPEECALILDMGLKLGFVTFAHEWSAQKPLSQMKALGIPSGCDLYLDVEDEIKKLSPGEALAQQAADLKARINAWAALVKDAGYTPGIYVGAGVPLNSAELYSLLVQRYWHSCSRVVDRDGNEAAPACGWVMHQLHPGNLTLNGVLVDIDVAQNDYHGRSVSVVTQWVLVDIDVAQNDYHGRSVSVVTQ